MRFRKGIHYEHPPRGCARKPYTVSEAARRQRCRNLRRTRLRSDRDLIWQSYFDPEPQPSQRTLARQLGVWPSYVCNVEKQTTRGLDALANGSRVSFDDLTEARRFTAKLRGQEPGLLAPRHAPVQLGNEQQSAMTADESIAETWREVREWKRSHPTYRSPRVPALGSWCGLHGRQFLHSR